MRVECVWINSEHEGRLGEGVQAVTIRVEADLGVVSKVFLQGELTSDAGQGREGRVILHLTVTNNYNVSC